MGAFCGHQFGVLWLLNTARIGGVFRHPQFPAALAAVRQRPWVAARMRGSIEPAFQ